MLDVSKPFSTTDCHQNRGGVCQNHHMDQNQNLIRTREIFFFFFFFLIKTKSFMFFVFLFCCLFVSFLTKGMVNSVLTEDFFLGELIGF